MACATSLPCKLLAWGSGTNNVPAGVAEYEVKALDGLQRFREYPDGKKRIARYVFPTSKYGCESELPQMVGTALRRKIHQAAESVVNRRPIRVFQYRAEAEDAICYCSFKSAFDHGLFPRNRIFTVPCYAKSGLMKTLLVPRLFSKLPHLRCPSEDRKDRLRTKPAAIGISRAAVSAIIHNPFLSLCLSPLLAGAPNSHL
jgi:hypothetical protein